MERAAPKFSLIHGASHSSSFSAQKETVDEFSIAPHSDQLSELSCPPTSSLAGIRTVSLSRVSMLYVHPTPELTLIAVSGELPLISKLYVLEVHAVFNHG